MDALTGELLIVTLPPSSPLCGESTSLGEGGSRLAGTVNCTDQHPEKPFSFACSAVSGGSLTSRTRLFPAASMPPSLQRPPHRGAGAEPRRALSPVSLAREKSGRRRQTDENVGGYDDHSASRQGPRPQERTTPSSALREMADATSPCLSGEADHRSRRSGRLP